MLALTVTTDMPITVANKAVETTQLVADKTSKV